MGLTGGLGSGKTTVAAMLAERGAHVLSADELARELMRPGTAVYVETVRQFGAGVVLADGELDRRELARLAFAEGRVEELNAIVHPATIARQQELIAEIEVRDAGAIVVVESALIFETPHAAEWRGRFDVMVLVTTPEHMKVERFVVRSGGGDRAGLEAEARRRLARMIPDEVKAGQCDVVVSNGGTREELEEEVGRLWGWLKGRRMVG